MKNKLLLLSLIAAPLISTIVFANPANTGIVVGGNLGYASVSTPNLNSSVVDPTFGIISTSQTDKHFAWGLNLGFNFAINPNLMLGVQGGYSSYGNSNYTTTVGSLGSSSLTLTTTAWESLITGTYVFDNGFNIFAKAGTAYEIEDGGSAGNDSAARPEIAGGVGYAWNNLNFTVEYRHIFADDQNSNDEPSGVPSVNAAMAGISYQFNF